MQARRMTISDERRGGVDRRKPHALEGTCFGRLRRVLLHGRKLVTIHRAKLCALGRVGAAGLREERKPATQLRRAFGRDVLRNS